MSEIGTIRRIRGWWGELDSAHQAVVVGGALGGIGAIVAALILGTINLIDSDEPPSRAPTAGVVSGEADPSGNEDQGGAQPPEEDAGTGEGPQGGTPDTTQPEPEPEPELTSGNGNSRAKATRLFPGVPMDKAVDNGTDVDWHVYRAPKEEEVELSLSMDAPEERGRR